MQESFNFKFPLWLDLGLTRVSPLKHTPFRNKGSTNTQLNTINFGGVILMRLLLRSFLVTCLCIAGSVAWAQTDRGTITGTVADASSAVIPGANITATNTQTTAKYETISTETGNYTLTQLPAGHMRSDCRAARIQEVCPAGRDRACCDDGPY
jgi:hypothetical protein